MRVVERLVVSGIPDVILAGPIQSGVCQYGDRLLLRGGSADREVGCMGIELLNWGGDGDDWVSLRVSDVELGDVSDVTEVVSMGAG